MSARGLHSKDKEPKHLSAQEADDLFSRLYNTENRKNAIQKLDKKYYPVEKERKTLTEEEIAESAEKHSVKAVENRKTRLGQLQAKYAREKANAAKAQRPKGHEGEEDHKMTEEELEEKVKNWYSDSVRIRGETLKKLQKKYTFHNQFAEREKNKKHTKEELQSSSARLSVPVKRTFTNEEIQKICGFKDYHDPADPNATQQGEEADD